MTREEIIDFIPSKWNVPTLLGGRSYAVPTLTWAQGPFWEYFRGELWDHNLDKWKVRWTCRDFARRYASMAQECWADTMGGTDDAIAIGEIWFDPEPAKEGDGHAICPIITGDGLVWLEPQNNTLYDMTPTRFESRFMVRF